MWLFQNQDLNKVLGKNLIVNQDPHQNPGLTPWNFDLACLSFIIHAISFILDPFIC